MLASRYMNVIYFIPHDRTGIFHNVLKKDKYIYKSLFKNMKQSKRLVFVKISIIYNLSHKIELSANWALFKFDINWYFKWKNKHLRVSKNTFKIN